jgi:ribosomal protein S8
MILESFMTEGYVAEFTYEDINRDSFRFPLEADNFEAAAVEAVEEIKTRGIIIEDKMIGRIKNPEGEYYEIFSGNWLVDFKTGKQLDSLEGKLD